MLRKFLGWLQRRRYAKLIRDYEKFYDNRFDVAMAMLSEGANQYFIEAFSRGMALEYIVIRQHPEEGYLIEAHQKDPISMEGNHDN